MTALPMTQLRGSTACRYLAGLLLLLFPAGPVAAGDVEIVGVEAIAEGDTGWRFDVTLRHGDTGWEHYADRWEVRLLDGTVLGRRVLLHPHVNGQPFTRSLSGVKVPADVGRVFVHAHDKVHGWSPDSVQVEMPR